MNIRHILAKMPTWFLRYLVWRDKRLSMAGHFQHNICWAAHELSERINPTVLGPEKPVGVPEWLGKEHKPYGENSKSPLGFTQKQRRKLIEWFTGPRREDD